MDKKTNWLIVKVGNLYYAQQLARVDETIKTVKSYELCTDANRAHIFARGLVDAEPIAKMLGGTLETIELTVDEAVKQQSNLEKYLKSESKWHEDASKEAVKILSNR